MKIVFISSFMMIMFYCIYVDDFCYDLCVDLENLNRGVCVFKEYF